MVSFIENDDVGLFVECASDADPLALSSGEADAAFTNIGLVLFWPAFDDVGNLCLLCCLLDEGVVDFRFWYNKGDVHFDGTIGNP